MAFVEAFVEEVIIEFSADDLKARPDLQEAFSTDSERILKAPVNSCIVRLIKSQTNLIIAYPFFPPHVMMPVKAGDSVWVIDLAGIFYWMVRKPQNNEVDDLSVTYAERASGTNVADGKTGAEYERANGGGNVIPRVRPVVTEAYTFLKEDGNPVVPELPVYSDFLDKRQHTHEPIPRFKNRPGDLVFQGSNNTLISLGTDRGYKREDEIDTATSNVFNKPEPGTGTIDIVTGRGRYGTTQPTTLDGLGHLPFRTSAQTITNSYEEIEIDKQPFENALQSGINRAEGDPDFGFDASRIYISSHTKIDENFSLIESYPPIPKIITEETGTVPEPVESAAIAIKSDEIRIIARRHLADEHFTNTADQSASAIDVNGSIKIIKEGTRDGDHATTDGQGAAVIMIQPDGAIMIDGPTVVIGTGRETDHGTGDQVFIGAGATEPIVLGNAMKALLETFFTDLTTFLSTKFDTHIHPTGVGPSGPPTVTGDDAGSGKAKDTLDSTLSKVGKTK